MSQIKRNIEETRNGFATVVPEDNDNEDVYVYDGCDSDESEAFYTDGDDDDLGNLDTHPGAHTFVE